MDDTPPLVSLGTRDGAKRSQRKEKCVRARGISRGALGEYASLVTGPWNFTPTGSVNTIQDR